MILASIGAPDFVCFFKNFNISVLVEVCAREMGLNDGPELGFPEPEDHFVTMATLKWFRAWTNYVKEFFS